MKILFAASEAVPFCKTGGLADVVGALSGELAAKGHQVRVLLPLYKQINRKKHSLKNLHKTLRIPMRHGIEKVGVWEVILNKNLKVWFVDAPAYFHREGLYGAQPGNDFPDNDLRYILFSRAVPEVAKALRFRPDIIHGHDWQTGLIPAYLKTIHLPDSFFEKTAAVFTIHNMAYQGLFPKETFVETGLPASEYRMGGVEFYDKVNFLKAGLIYSDALNTVSETYAQEISSSYEYGYGLEGVLQSRIERLRGIRNGVDVQQWDPQKDKQLAVRFRAASLAKRSFEKMDLRMSARISTTGNPPVFGFVARLDYQKGVDIVLEAAPLILSKGMQLVVLGVGHQQHQKDLQSMANRFPTLMHVETQFAEALAHKIYGGSDMFLMPSRFEPCGLSQMIAMRYGSVPVVTPTGGLIDTVDHVYNSEQGTGFVAEEKTAAAFISAIDEALRWWSYPNEWRKIQKRGMSRDFSWSASIPAYIRLYRDALKWKKQDNA